MAGGGIVVFPDFGNGASLYVPGYSRFHTNVLSSNMPSDFGPCPEDLYLLQDAKWGTLFDRGFHCDRGGTLPLALLVVFLRIALTFLQPQARENKVVRLKR